MEINENQIRILKQFVNVDTLDNVEIVETIGISKSGLPCMFEYGGAFTNTSEAQIISDEHGNPKVPVHIYTKGDLCNQKHAVIPIVLGDLVFKARGNREGTHVLVYKVTDINIETKQVTLSLSDFNDNILPFLAVANKAWTYHCKKPHYIKTKSNRPTTQTTI